MTGDVTALVHNERECRIHRNNLQLLIRSGHCVVISPPAVCDCPSFGGDISMVKTLCCYTEVQRNGGRQREKKL